MNEIEIDGAPAETDADAEPPIAEVDIRVIAANLHDQGAGHVLPDMIEGVTGVRPPDEDFSPRKMRIRDPERRKAREKAERQKNKADRRARMTDEEKAKQIGNLQLWKADNPDKMQAADDRRLQEKKTARKSREFIAVDLEGFDTGRYFTDDRPDYLRAYREAMARGVHEREGKELDELNLLLHDHIVISEEERLAQVHPFAGWTPHDHKWYLVQHDLTNDPIPSARNKKPGTPPIYIEHRPFLFGAGNDRVRYFLTEECEWTTDQSVATTITKTALSGIKILNAIVDLRKRFGDAIFVTFAFGYDVAQILRILDADTAGKLQAGEIIIESLDDAGAPCEEVIEQAVFFWNEFAISYRRGKMFRVGRLKDRAVPYIYTEITDPERRQAYIDAGRKPLDREINYEDDPVTLNDTFGFFQMSFIDAYEGSNISFTIEERKVIFEGKRSRYIMASLPMDVVVEYQGMELRILPRMMDKLRQTTNSLDLSLPHWQGAGAISSAMASKHRAGDFDPKIRGNNCTPQQDCAHHCFAGGHIEMMMQGRYGGVLTGDNAQQTKLIYGFDITSAYPSKQFILPAMALPIEWELRKDGSLGKVTKRIEGKWIWREGAELTEDIIKTLSVYSMIEIKFAFPEKCFDKQSRKLRDAPWYPLFYRSEDGSILFPARGVGRYYRGEVLQAFDWVRRMRPDMNAAQHKPMIELRGAWEFICPTIDDLTPDQLETMKRNCPSARIGEDGLVYPFQYIKDYYDERARYPKTDARNQILKLGINGAWGKKAQSVGGRNGMPPACASPWYAGVVTSETRAQCVTAMLQAPWNIIHVATDGIQANTPLGIESEKKMLGTWEMDTFTRGVYIKPGIYAYGGGEYIDETIPTASLDAMVADHLFATKVYDPSTFKGKSRGVGLRSVLGEDGNPDTKRYIQKEWFDYLDDLAFECYSKARPIASLPHRKLITFGLAASNPELWPMCGHWIEDTRIFKMDEAGIKRGICFDPDRKDSLVLTSVAINKTPKILSKRHEPKWLDVKSEAILRDINENAELARAHDWDCCWDVGGDE